MKRIISSIILLMIVTILMFSVKSYAVLLDKIDVQVDKQIVRAGEDVTVKINFGENLRAYTVNIAYDNKLFRYVDSEGGTANETLDKVKVFLNQTDGNGPRSTMSVTFKANEAVTTSNPTEFTITAEGMVNDDATVTFDDITIPIIKNVVVEPEYSDYSLKLEYTGDIIENEEKNMKLSYSSSSGRHYEKARLVAEATTPEGASVQLIGIDNENLKHDIIQSGWGDAQGYSIGGKNFSQILDVQGTFSKSGSYSITLKLIDRNNSDSVIAQNTFNINVVESEEKLTTLERKDENIGEVKKSNTPTEEQIKQPTTQNDTNTPTKLPKTGTNIYIPIGMMLFSLIGAFIINNKNRQ